MTGVSRRLIETCHANTDVLSSVRTMMQTEEPEGTKHVCPCHRGAYSKRGEGCWSMARLRKSWSML